MIERNWIQSGSLSDVEKLRNETLSARLQLCWPSLHGTQPWLSLEAIRSSFREINLVYANYGKQESSLLYFRTAEVSALLASMNGLRGSSSFHRLLLQLRTTVVLWIEVGLGRTYDTDAIFAEATCVHRAVPALENKSVKLLILRCSHNGNMAV